MKEVGQWKFEVLLGETVYLRVVARETEARFVRVWMDDNQKLVAADEPYDYRQYSFQVFKDPGQKHVLMLECNFPEFAPDAARFDLWIGSDAGREFLRMVSKTAGKNRDFTSNNRGRQPLVRATWATRATTAVLQVPRKGPSFGSTRITRPKSTSLG